MNHSNRCVHRTSVKKEAYDPTQKTLTGCYKRQKQQAALARREEEYRQAREHGSYVNPLASKSDDAVMLGGWGGHQGKIFTKGKKVFSNF